MGTWDKILDKAEQFAQGLERKAGENGDANLMVQNDSVAKSDTANYNRTAGVAADLFKGGVDAYLAMEGKPIGAAIDKVEDRYLEAKNAILDIMPPDSTPTVAKGTTRGPQK